MIRNTYGDLLKPANIGTMELKNRICMAPMDFKFFDGDEEDSSMSYRQVKVFEERAKGGCGLIFTCATHAVHVYGSKIACELTMGSGRYADKVDEKCPPIAPSYCKTQYDSNLYAREMTVPEIKQMIRTYAEAAGRLKKVVLRT